MKNNHQQYLVMCKSVLKFYRKNEELLDNIKGLKNNFLKLVALKDRLSLELDISISYSNGYSITRARKRDDLQKKCISMCIDIIKLKESIKYKPIPILKSFISFSYSELNAFSELELINYASSIYDIILIAKPRLKIQGTKDKAFDDFAKVLTLFALDFPMNSQAIEQRKLAALNSLKTYSDLNEFFNEKIDPVFDGLKDENHTIYHLYQVARIIPEFNFNKKADFEGTLSNKTVFKIAHLKYDVNREFRLSIEGGNAVWGLSDHEDSIDNARPISPREKFKLKSSLIGNSGDFLLIQAVNNDAKIKFKCWVYN